MRSLLAVDRNKWLGEMQALSEYFQGYGRRMPAALLEELNRTRAALAQ